MTPDLAAALQFIEKIERANAAQSVYEIANQLRGYTKPSYTTLLWSTATGYKQPYIEGEFKGKLNQELLLSGEKTDFGHFIAALADQINQPGVRWSDLTSWTADHTSWAGDMGSAIATFHAQGNNPKIPTVLEALNRYASDSDYAANIAAYVVGVMLNFGKQAVISQAIAHYDAQPYAENIRWFLQERFKGAIAANQLENPAEVEAEIRRAISTYIRLSPDSGLFESVKNLLKLDPQLQREDFQHPNAAELLQGSLHFMTYLVKKAGLEPLKFKPYQLPKVPWLGTVSYEVKVPN
ncbi:MAG: hypothetical protein KME12_09275 [Trichocoleus desertorum ATA4-8-CV12]|jgi:hypothetical protein|nr:hypothetical protein [Trichocoleus desertorum ATA4-8-CV12]